MKIHFNNTGYFCRAPKPNNIKPANFLTFQGYATAKSGDIFITQKGNLEELNELLKQENFTLENQISTNEVKIIKKNIPLLNKNTFTVQDFNNLTKQQIEIIDNLINKGKKLRNSGRIDCSIKKDAQRILYLSQQAKEKLDIKYTQGYKLISIGNSPAPFVETMKILGADTDVIPFSKRILMGKFPFVRVKENGFQKYKKEDWENYFKFFGITPKFTNETGKKLIFTDYSSSGETIENMFKPMLRALEYPKETLIANLYEILPTRQDLIENKNAKKILGDFNLANVIYKSDFKKYSSTPSVKNTDFDLIKHPELIKTIPQSMESKLLKYTIFKLCKY